MNFSIQGVLLTNNMCGLMEFGCTKMHGLHELSKQNKLKKKSLKITFIFK